MKYKLALILALLLAVITFTGCGIYRTKMMEKKEPEYRAELLKQLSEKYDDTFIVNYGGYDANLGAFEYNVSSGKYPDDTFTAFLGVDKGTLMPTDAFASFYWLVRMGGQFGDIYHERWENILSGKFYVSGGINFHDQKIDKRLQDGVYDPETESVEALLKHPEEIKDAVVNLYQFSEINPQNASEFAKSYLKTYEDFKNMGITNVDYSIAIFSEEAVKDGVDHRIVQLHTLGVGSSEGDMYQAKYLEMHLVTSNFDIDLGSLSQEELTQELLKGMKRAKKLKQNWENDQDEQKPEN